MLKDGSSTFLNGLGIDEPLTITTGATTQTYLGDHLGSTSWLSDANGAFQTRYDYASYGKLESGLANPSASNALTYTGREDDGTGLMYYRARYYDPSLERFISDDPLGDAQRYVGGNPVGFVDPDGNGKIGFAIKTAKGAWKLVRSKTAQKAFKKGKDVLVTGEGAGKQAKKLSKSKFGDKTVHHDAHAPNQNPHYQSKYGKNNHAFYKNLSSILTPCTFVGLFGDSPSNQASDLINPFSDLKDAIDFFAEMERGDR